MDCIPILHSIAVGNGLGKKIGGILPEHNLKFMALGQHKDHFCLGDVRGPWQCNLDPYIRDYLTAQAKVLRIGQVALGYSGSCVIVGNDGVSLVALIAGRYSSVSLL